VPGKQVCPVCTIGHHDFVRLCAHSNMRTQR
jgi:rubredoxin